MKRPAMCRATVRALAVAVLVTTPSAGQSEPVDERALLQSLAARCGSELRWASTWDEASQRARAEDKAIVAFVQLYSPFSALQAGPLMDTEVIRLVNEHFVPYRYERGKPCPLDDPERYGLGPYSFGSSALITTPDGEVLGDLLSPQTFPLRAFLRTHAGDGPADGPHAEASEPVATIDEAVRALRSGDFAAARELLQGLTEPLADHERLPEVLAWLGSAESALGETPTSWRRVVRKHPESRWAWVAASRLLEEPSPERTARQLRRPDDGVLEFLAIPASEPVGPGEVRRAIDDATSFLLLTQREDGSWRSTPAEMGAGAYRTLPLTAAVTAVCALGLLDHGEPRAEPAVRRALAFIRHWSAALATPRQDTFLLDYGPWAYAYALRLLARAKAAGLADPTDLAAEVAALLGALRDCRRSGGGWTYRIYQEIRGGLQVVPDSASFLTADVLLALDQARRAGFEVPTDLVDDALACLQTMRTPGRGYEYFLADGDDARRFTTEAGAAGRGPVCTLALHRGGRATVDELRASLDVFLAHRASYAAERGKSIMHAAPDSQGSHYLLFDDAWSARAAAELPEDEQAPYREALLADVLAARLAGGSFLDNAINGRHYGAGMALVALALLDDSSP